MSAAERRPRVLLCVCGSVAAVKVPQLACALAEFAEVKVALSKAAEHFFDRVAPSYDADAWAAFSKRADSIAVLRDSDEWASYSAVGTDPVLHIELRKWADVAVVAPLSANTLAKISGGMCDNLVTCVLRAWPIGAKPVLLCPAMNTAMWDHPLTAAQLEQCRSVLRFDVLDPVVKTLACGDTGSGALAPVDAIAARVLALTVADKPAT